MKESNNRSVLLRVGQNILETKDLSTRILQYQKILINQPFSDCKNFRYYFQKLIEDIAMHPRNYELVSTLGKYSHAITAKLYRVMNAQASPIVSIGGVYRFLVSVGYTHAHLSTLQCIEKQNRGTVADTLLSSTYSSYVSKNLQAHLELFYDFYEKILVDIEHAPPTCLEHVLEDVLQFQEVANCFILMPPLKLYQESIQHTLVEQIEKLSFESMKLTDLHALKDVIDQGLDKKVFGAGKQTVYECRKTIIGFIKADEGKLGES